MKSVYAQTTRIDDPTAEEYRTFLQPKKTVLATTLNPEILLRGWRHAEFARALSKSDLALADGIGLHLAFWKAGEALCTRRTGVTLLRDILRSADEKTFILFLLSPQGLTQETDVRNALTQHYPQLRYATQSFDFTKDTAELLQILRTTRYTHIISNAGAPDQEIFLAGLKNAILTELPERALFLVGIGGALDYFTHVKKLPPRVVRILGLEWLYRLCQEPRYRARRILRAIIIYPIRLFLPYA